MLEKIFSTVHISNMLLQQQYQEKGFTKYSDIISCLFFVKQNNELLMKNHKSRPIGTTSFLKANVMNLNRGRGRGHGKGRDGRRERNNYYFCGGRSY